VTVIIWYFRGIRPGLIEASSLFELGLRLPKGISGASAPASLKRLKCQSCKFPRHKVFPGHPPRPH